MNRASVEEQLVIKAISADSHVTEPPNCYVDHIDPAYRDRAPRVVRQGEADLYMVEDVGSVPVGLAASAGVDPKDRNARFLKYEELHRGGWDAKARIADQDRDGIAAEVVYPTVGMVIYGNPDPGFQDACCWAYNRWLAEFVACAPQRVYGIGQTALRTVEEGVRDIERVKALGFRGIMVPGEPTTEADYDDSYFDPFWEAAAAADLPISFHIFTGKSGRSADKTYRGSQAINMWSTAIRVNQDVLGMLVFGGVFDRHPRLKVVCVEADAGWLPHYLYRADGMYRKHRWWQKTMALEKLPSDYFAENIYLTFQDDLIAFRSTDIINPRRLMWANDFPHSDATWPWSQELLSRHTAGLSRQHQEWILRDNARELYNIHIDAS